MRPFANLLSGCSLCLAVMAVGCGMVLTPTVAAAEPQEIAARPSLGTGGKTGSFRNLSLKVGDHERFYRLLVPENLNQEKPVPLLFAFHGFLIDSKDLMPIYSRLDRLAKEKGFILVFPNSRGPAWNIVLDWAKEDLAFFDALYGQLTSQYNIDLNRVYAAGMSNGAYFSHLLATQRSTKIAAICSHSGGLGLVALAQPKCECKYAVFVVHGLEDRIVPVGEGQRTRDHYQKWGHELEYLEIPKLSHFWGLKAGVNEKMWTFFLAHPLQASPQ